jgi:hypothetical protein
MPYNQMNQDVVDRFFLDQSGFPLSLFLECRVFDKGPAKRSLNTNIFTKKSSVK